MSRWQLVQVAGTPRVDVYVQDAQLGRTLVGSLWLNDQDQAELAELLGGVRP